MTATVDTFSDLATEPLRSRRNHWNNQIRRHAFMTPDKPALKFLGNVTTWKELDERSRAFAAALSRRGVQFGDRVLIVLLNRSEYVEAVLGANLIGAIPVPVNIRMSPAEVAYLVDNSGARVIVTEIDPICALQAAMDGYQVARLEDVVETADIFVTATGNKDVITVDHMRRMRNNAIVCNIGHFDNEIQMDRLNASGAVRDNIKPQVDRYTFSDSGRSIYVLAEGRLINLGCAHGHPAFVMSNSFSNQTLAALDLWENKDVYEKTVYRLPKKLDEEVARLHLEQIGVKLTTLTPEQAAYLGVPVEGPYKPEHYRY